MRLRYGVTSEPAIERIDSANQRRLLFARALEAEIGQQLYVTIRDIRERLRRSA